MPEIITILFDCSSDGLSYDPLLYDALDKCKEVKEDLLEFLDDNGVSYYLQNVTDDEYDVVERKFMELGIRERGG